LKRTIKGRGKGRSEFRQRGNDQQNREESEGGESRIGGEGFQGTVEDGGRKGKKLARRSAVGAAGNFEGKRKRKQKAQMIGHSFVISKTHVKNRSGL